MLSQLAAAAHQMEDVVMAPDGASVISSKEGNVTEEARANFRMSGKLNRALGEDVVTSSSSKPSRAPISVKLVDSLPRLITSLSFQASFLKSSLTK